MAIQIGALVDVISGSFGIEVVELVDSKGQGADQECREVTIWPESGESIKIGETADKAAAGPVLIPDTEEHLRLPIVNTNLLFFNGITGKKIYLLWRL